MKNLITSLLSFIIVFSCYSPSYSNPIESNEDTKRVITMLIEKDKKEMRIKRILTTLRKIESNNDYAVKGQSGEYGAYQFTKRTWEMYCSKFFNQSLSITNKSNQDEVAKTVIIDLVEKGYSNEQIASIWNCGSPKWKGKEGVNRFGVQYSVPKYVNKFITTYNSIA